METLVLTILQLLQGLLSQLGTNNTAVNQILAALVQIVPIVVNLSAPIVNSVKAIISALENSGALTDDQLATLTNLSADLDASWQSTVAAYNASKGIVATSPSPAAAVTTPASEDTAATTAESAAPLAPAG
jgi:hypothetical protein